MADQGEVDKRGSNLAMWYRVQSIGGGTGYGTVAADDVGTKGSPLTTTGPQANELIRMHQRMCGSLEKGEREDLKQWKLYKPMKGPQNAL